MSVLTVANSLMLSHLHTHIDTYGTHTLGHFCLPDSLQCYECAMLAPSVFHLSSALGSMQQLFVGHRSRENTAAVEGKNFGHLMMSHKAFIFRAETQHVCPT